MKKISRSLLVSTIANKRKEKKLTQAQLAEAANMNRSMIGRLENGEYTPSLDQLDALGDVLGFEMSDLYEAETITESKPVKENTISTRMGAYRNISIIPR